MQAPNQQQQEQQEITGRLGEEYVYKHRCKKYCNEAHIEWVNEAVEKDNGVREFVEVKATRSTEKNWFELSVFEWEFANKMGERYSIFRIFLLPNQQARLVVLNNPAQLCRDKLL